MVIGALIMNSVNRSQKQLFENCLKYFFKLPPRESCTDPSAINVALGNHVLYTVYASYSP